MTWRGIQSFFYMIPVIWSFLKDLIWEEFSFEEIITHYSIGKANAYDRANLLNRSVRVYKEILKGDPNRVPVLFNLGGLYYRRGLYESAIPYYEKVIRTNPKHYQGHYWLAMCYFNLQRYYVAINTLEEVIEFLPTFKDALNLIGECYEHIGQGAKAEHYYLKAIRTDPLGIIIYGEGMNPESRERKREERIKH